MKKTQTKQRNKLFYLLILGGGSLVFLFGGKLLFNPPSSLPSPMSASVSFQERLSIPRAEAQAVFHSPLGDTIAPSSKEVYLFQTTDAGYRAFFKEMFGKWSIARLEKGEAWIEVQPGALKWVFFENGNVETEQLISEPTLVKGMPLSQYTNRMQWPNAYGGKLNFEWVADPGKLVKYLHIENFTHFPPLIDALNKVKNKVFLDLSLTFTFSPDMQVSSEKLNNGAKVLVLKKSNKEIAWKFLPPVYWDSSGTGGKEMFEVVIDNPKSIQETGSFALSLRIPYGWLEKALYPVTIDPEMEAEDGEEDDDKKVIRDPFITIKDALPSQPGRDRVTYDPIAALFRYREDQLRKLAPRFGGSVITDEHYDIYSGFLSAVLEYYLSVAEAEDVLLTYEKWDPVTGVVRPRALVTGQDAIAARLNHVKWLYRRYVQPLDPILIQVETAFRAGISAVDMYSYMKELYVSGRTATTKQIPRVAPKVMPEGSYNFRNLLP